MPWEKKRPQSLRPERSREPDSARQVSRPFRPQPIVISPPRASAFGLSPGLYSPDPLGRTRAERFLGPAQLFCGESLALSRAEPGNAWHLLPGSKPGWAFYLEAGS